MKALRQRPAHSRKFELRLQHLNRGMLFNLSEKMSIAGVSVDRRPCRSLLGMDLTGHCRVSMGTQRSKPAPARPRAVLVHDTTHNVPQNFNAQRKQTSATNTSDALYASVEMNTTFHITVDYTSYSSCTIYASPYVAKRND